jgi:hypothetical protein
MAEISVLVFWVVTLKIETMLLRNVSTSPQGVTTHKSNIDK